MQHFIFVICLIIIAFFIIFIVTFVRNLCFVKSLLIFTWLLLYIFEIQAFSLGTSVNVEKNVIPGTNHSSKLFVFFSPGTFSIRGVVKSRVCAQWCALATIFDLLFFGACCGPHCLTSFTH